MKVNLFCNKYFVIKILSCKKKKINYYNSNKNKYLLPLIYLEYTIKAQVLRLAI